MTECDRKSLAFSSLSRKQILADFDGGHLTSDGGALLLREVDQRTGLIAALADCIADPRDPAKIRHDLRTMLAQRVHGIALGYEDGNDHQTLRNDPIMQMLAGDAPQPVGQAHARLPVALYGRYGDAKRRDFEQDPRSRLRRANSNG